SDARNFGKFNNKENNAVVGMSLDGNTIYLLNAYLNKKKTLDKGIAISHKKGNHWTDPVKLEIPNLKIEGNFYGFYVNPQETVILVSYNGPGSLGDEDLYVCTKQSDGTWSKPTTLGPKINTKGYEMSPYLSEDGYTLFWSTDGRGGEGDADIFVSFRTDDTWTQWSEPVNMGNKINSKGFDAYFIMSQNDAWFASDRDGHGKDDIYHCHAIEPEPVVDTVRVDTTVVEPITVPVIIETSVANINRNRMEDIIPKLPLFVEVKLYFATNSSFIEPDSKQIIDSVIRLMKKYPTVVAEIHSHADKRASYSYNEWLTMRRAHRVVDYMVLMGLEPKKVTANWYGKTKIAVECEVCTEAQLRASRRTVIKLSRIE
ncbi:MAG: OmpA family protein, partial [Flavobacteriales bacterium]